jgi:hypothetical protein
VTIPGWAERRVHTLGESNIEEKARFLVELQTYLSELWPSLSDDVQPSHFAAGAGVSRLPELWHPFSGRVQGVAGPDGVAEEAVSVRRSSRCWRDRGGIGGGVYLRRRKNAGRQNCVCAAGNIYCAGRGDSGNFLFDVLAEHPPLREKALGPVLSGPSGWAQIMVVARWPEFWCTILELRWLVWPAAVLAIVVLLLWAPGVKRRWLQIVLRVVGGTAVACILIVVAIGVAFNSGSPETQSRTVSSPSGSHHATLTYDVGFLGRDFSVVTVTKNGCCQHFAAYEYAGPSNLQSTTMLWLDETHLQIEYRADPHRYQRCSGWVADVTITCVPFTAGNN